MSLLSAISVISLLVMFPVLLSLRKTGAPGIASFCLACGLSALALVSGFASSAVLPSFDAVFGSVLMIAASLMSLNGFRAFLRRKPLGIRFLATLLVCIAIVLGAFSYTVDGRNAVLVLSAGLACLIDALTAMTILRHWSRERAIAPYVLFCGLSACALSALQATQVVAATTDFGNMHAPEIWMTALIAARQIVMPLFLIGVILLLHGWMIANLRHMIAHDELTEALSRRAFMAEYERMFQATAVSGQEMTFMLLDLDRFKQINDLHGHAGGDAALAHFSAVARETLAGRGMLGRLGGEEFGVLTTGIGQQEAITIASEICAAIRAAPTSTFNGLNIMMTVSIGVCIVEPGATLAEVMMQADMALYEAKAKGRDRFVIAGGLHTASESSARVLAGAAAQMRAAGAATMPPRPVADAG